jgi:hypothetical protein
LRQRQWKQQTSVTDFRLQAPVSATAPAATATQPHEPSSSFFIFLVFFLIIVFFFLFELGA